MHGGALLNALSAEELNENQIGDLLRKACGEGVRRRIRSVTKMVRRRGIDISKMASQDELFDRESGRRVSDE